jgi:hypothetical protein
VPVGSRGRARLTVRLRTAHRSSRRGAGIHPMTASSPGNTPAGWRSAPIVGTGPGRSAGPTIPRR